MTRNHARRNGGAEQHLAPAPVDTGIFTDKQAAEFLQIESRTLRLWRQKLGLPHIRITQKTLRYRRADLEQWLGRRRVAING
jgi:hypothetical protein